MSTPRRRPSSRLPDSGAQQVGDKDDQCGGHAALCGSSPGRQSTGCSDTTSAPGPACAPMAGPVSTSQPSRTRRRARSAASSAWPSSAHRSGRRPGASAACGPRAWPRKRRSARARSLAEQAAGHAHAPAGLDLGDRRQAEPLHHRLRPGGNAAAAHGVADVARHAQVWVSGRRRSSSARIAARPAPAPPFRRRASPAGPGRRRHCRCRTRGCGRHGRAAAAGFRRLQGARHRARQAHVDQRADGARAGIRTAGGNRPAAAGWCAAAPVRCAACGRTRRCVRPTLSR